MSVVYPSHLTLSLYRGFWMLFHFREYFKWLCTSIPSLNIWRKVWTNSKVAKVYSRICLSRLALTVSERYPNFRHYLFLKINNKISPYCLKCLTRIFSNPVEWIFWQFNRASNFLLDMSFSVAQQMLFLLQLVSSWTKGNNLNRMNESAHQWVLHQK